MPVVYNTVCICVDGQKWEFLNVMMSKANQNHDEFLGHGLVLEISIFVSYLCIQCRCSNTFWKCYCRAYFQRGISLGVSPVGIEIGYFLCLKQFN